MNNILILGDSYSTYEGNIPEGYETYYKIKACGDDPSVKEMKLEQTWWKQVLTAIDGNLLINNSWSGSTVCYIGYNGVDCSKSSSFIYRFRKLIEEGFFKENKIDTVFVFGAINDCWCGADFGEIQFSDWTEEDLHKVLPAICCLIHDVKIQLPKSEIYFIISDGLKPEIGKCVKRASKYFKIKPIELHDIDKECGHPTVKGMKQISEQVLSAMGIRN